MTIDSMPTLIVVDDDLEDQLLVKTAVRRANLPMRVQCLRTGNELMQWLQDSPGPFNPMAPTNVILLDLNMPGKDGRACLRELKSNPVWASIPVIVFSTSDAPDDIYHCYELNANSYICKPDDLTRLQHIITVVYRYWFGHTDRDLQESIYE